MASPLRDPVLGRLGHADDVTVPETPAAGFVAVGRSAWPPQPGLPVVDVALLLPADLHLRQVAALVVGTWWPKNQLLDG